MNLVILGPQGSGKGTQSIKLAEKYNLIHIETGQIFREIAKNKSDLGKIVANLNKKKEMIPDNITMDVLREYLIKVPQESGIILDSAPRTAGQIKPVEKMLAEFGRSLDKVIYIALSYDDSIARIAKRYACVKCQKPLMMGRDVYSAEDVCPICGGAIKQRDDDTPKGINKRLKTFYDVTLPVVDRYRSKGILIEVNGNQNIEKVFEDIVLKISN